MSEIVTYESQREAIRWRPYRQGFDFALYQNAQTKLYQWVNDPLFATRTGLVKVYPGPEPTVGGFGISSFGNAPFGR